MSNPQLDAIFQDLKAEISEIITRFWASLQSQNPQAPQPVGPKYKNLPWFQHGVRGFLSKLWHGDHPDNPLWKNVQRENTQNRLKLQEYVEIRGKFEAFLAEEGVPNDILNALVTQIMTAVNNSFQKAYTAGFERTPEAAPTDPQPQAAPVVTPAPTDQGADEPKTVPVEAPTSTGNLKTKSTKPRAARGNKKLAPVSTTATEAPTDAPAASAEAPAEIPNDDDLDDEKLETIGMQIVASGGDITTIHDMLRANGLPIANGKVPATAAKNVVKVVHYLASNGDLEMDKNDWIDPNTYKDKFGLKINSAALRNAINVVGLELHDKHIKNKGDFSNVASSVGSFDDTRENVKRYRQMLREGNKTQANMIAAKSLSPNERTKFFKGCLAN